MGHRVTSSAVAWGFPGCTSSLQALSSTLHCRPVSSTMAPCPLSSTRDRRPFGSSRLPRPTGSTCDCHIIATDFWGCLLLSSPLPLRLCRTPSSLKLHQGTRSHQHCLGPPPSGYTSVTRCRDCALVPVSINVAGSLGSSNFAWDSLSPRLTSVSWAQVSTMVPSSFSSTMGHLPPGCLPLCTGLSLAIWILPPSTPPWALPKSTPPWSL